MSDLDRIKKLSGIEQVKEGPNMTIANMPFMKAIKQYVEDQDGVIVGDEEVDEPRLYIDGRKLIDDVRDMLEAEYPDAEIIALSESKG